MSQQTINEIRTIYQNSITQSCREKKCSLRLDGLRRSSLAIIHGSKYQKNHGYTEKLCDRIVFCGDHGFFLAAVELKGGKGINMSQAITQIQNGLVVVTDVLKGQAVVDWFPLLVYSGGMRTYETSLLRNSSVAFQGKRKNIIKVECTTRLDTVL